MKVITPEEQAAHRAANVTGAVQGALVGALIAIPGHFLLRRFSPAYLNAPTPFKAFAATVITVPCVSIASEKAGETYDRSTWTGVGKDEMDAVARRETERLAGLGGLERVSDWSKRNKWGLLGCSWAGAMGGSFALVSRNKYQTFTQKLVQARVYAQGLTVVGVLVAAVLSGTARNDEEVHVAKSDHSWADILEQEGYKVKDGDEIKVSRLLKERAAAKTA